MYEIIVKGARYVLTTENWKDLRIYLKIHYHKGLKKITEELGYLDIRNELEDELYLRLVPDEIGDFILENRTRIIEEAEY